MVGAMPLFVRENVPEQHQKMTSEEFWTNLALSVFLVLAGGVFAGLTLGLMGQDEVYLKVIALSGEPAERKSAKKVLRLIGRGKHWVLVTLLLSNVITNETLPIVLDRCLGGGWPAVVASTALIVVFGEIIPQSICVRYGLQVGAIFSPFVLVLMFLMYPIAYPISLLLDHILGEDHGTVYKKSGLKTLVTLHKTMGVERLNQDEVTIISAVLDLKEKPVSHIMTPMNRVYTMSADTILNEQVVEEIFNAGFSRIPIHLPNDPLNFIGMLLVRVLISYDPEDALPVASFPLATLPETSLDTSCLNILNYFQEGKSHMIVVSETPGEQTGAVGVLTLEDVIEELIGEEIVDESDVYVDINRNIKRSQPGPLSKRNLTAYLHNLYQLANTLKRNSLDSKDFDINRENNQSSIETRPKKLAVPSPGNAAALADAKTWKPKNPASNPLETNKLFVTIKRPASDVIAAAVPGVKKATPTALGVGIVHSSEEGAIRDAHKRASIDNLNGYHNDSQQDLNGLKSTNNDGEASKNGDTDSVHHHRIPDGGEPKGDATLEYLESRSYRTGGIIESVIEVQGVHKTIIENVSDEDEIAVEDALGEDKKKKKKRRHRKNKRSDLFTMNNYRNGSHSSEGSQRSQRSQSTEVSPPADQNGYDGSALSRTSSNDSVSSNSGLLSRSGLIASGATEVWNKITGKD